MLTPTRVLAAHLLLWTLPLSTQTASAGRETDLGGIDAAVATALARWNVPGVAVSVVRDGRVVLAEGYGVRDPTTGQPMTRDTIFPIASVSKSFTSFGVGLLADEGRLSLDAPVAACLPGFALEDPAATLGLTLRDALSHRSGMPRHDNLRYHHTSLTREGLLTRMPFLEPSAPLLAKWQYNNAMFILAGLAVDHVAGQRWETFTEARIFRPLAMTRTGLSPERAAADPDHCGGRVVLNGKGTNVPLFHTEGLLNPAGGVYSTAANLANWMLVHLSDGVFAGQRLIRPSTLTELLRTQMATGATGRDPEVVPVGYGLGWFTDVFRGQPMVSHGGNLPGVSSLVALLPERRLGVVVLVNHGNSELREALARTILDRYLGATGRDWLGEALARKVSSENAEVGARGRKNGSRVAGTHPSHALADYAGEYLDPGYGVLTIRVEGDRLVGQYNDDRSPLDHWHYDVFDASTTDGENLWLDARVQFVTDLAGRIATVQVALEPSVAPVAFRKQPDARLSDPAYLRGLTGTYDYAGTPVTISLAGQRLVWLLRGSAPTDLLPGLGGEFVHARVLDARVAFQSDAAGRAVSFTRTDTTGVYEEKRTD